MTDLSNTKRIPLAADTEPTDEELGEVMREPGMPCQHHDSI
jgi:hypothetical protein